jgi:hypothetical protein
MSLVYPFFPSLDTQVQFMSFSELTEVDTRGDTKINSTSTNEMMHTHSGAWLHGSTAVLL